jgi:hypothetical protein
MHLRTDTLAGEYDFVRLRDPAWVAPEEPERKPDESDAEWAAREEAWTKEAQAFADAYNRGRETGDFSKMPTKEGAKPAVWRFRHLSAKQRAWIRDQHQVKGPYELALDAVALALVGVTGHAGADGQPLVIERRKDPDRRGWMAVAEEQLVWLDASAGLLELGNAVFATLLPRSG